MKILDKEQLRSVNTLAFFTKCNEDDALFKLSVISMFKLRDQAIKRFKNMGFKTLKVSPYQANCIIRVFQRHHMSCCESKLSYYGIVCFYKKEEEWYTYFNGREAKINFSNQVVKERDFKFCGSFEDETDEFFDTYLELS